MGNKNLDNLCEKDILFLILAALIFSALATGAVRTMEFAIVQGLIAAAAILWIARIWVDPNHNDYFSHQLPGQYSSLLAMLSITT